MTEKIYWLAPNVRFEDQLCYESSMRLETVMCPHRPDHTIRNRWSRPLKLIGPIRSRTDFEWTVYGDVIVGDSIARSFTKAGFSGLQLLPVEFHISTNIPFSRESLELRVHGWGGCASQSSGITEIERCTYCGRQVFSDYSYPERLFSGRGWDGSDLFRVWPLPRFIMITGRVREFVLDSRFSGVRIRALRELPLGVPGTLTPGHLSDWFDDERIRRIKVQ